MTLRRAAARATLAPLRAGLSRLADPVLARPGGGEAATGPIAINPSGALMRGRRRIAPSYGGAPDWLVHAFPSVAIVATAAPVWYGARADTVALLTEALPAVLALDDADPAFDAVAYLGLSLGRLDRTQEALNARLFRRRRVRVHGALRVVRADRIVLPPQPPFDARALAAAGARLFETFRPDVAADLVLAPHGSVAGGLDPDRTPLTVFAAALGGARTIETPQRWAALGALKPEARLIVRPADHA